MLRRILGGYAIIEWLQALVDKKRVVVTEAAIMYALHLDDVEEVDFLPNEEIFMELARMGYEKPITKLTFYKAFFSSQWKFLIYTILQSMSAKRTSWNEFSSAMASAVICLSTGDLSTHSTKYISPALTQKVFANIRRVGKGCSGVETPLFEGMIAAREPENQGNAEEHGDEEEHGTDNAAAEELVTAINDVQSPPPQQQSPPPPQPQGAHFPMSLLQEALDAYVALTRRVEHLEHDKVAQDLEILKLKTRVKKLERANKVKIVKLKRLRKVGTSQRIESSDDTLIEDVSNQGREINRAEYVMKETEEVKEYTADTQVEGRQADIYHIDMDHATKVLISDVAVIPSAIPKTISVAAIPTVRAPPIKVVAPVKATVPSTRQKRGVVIKDPEEESSAKTPTETTSKDKGKCILVEEPKPMKKKQQVELDEATSSTKHDDVSEEYCWIKEEESRAIASINETPAQKEAKRRKLIEEAKEAESIKQHLQRVLDEDDDVFTDATPLARKVPVVDYQTMFERPDGQDNVWRNQSTIHGHALDKSWKLLTCCGVHIISFNTTQIILLVERRYPIMKFTLEQMLNVVRLQVEEESEMSLELIRFTRQQLQEAQHN
nr:hypothetical protein [Tanacetum cinerariifolium]